MPMPLVDFETGKSLSVITLPKSSFDRAATIDLNLRVEPQ